MSVSSFAPAAEVEPAACITGPPRVDPESLIGLGWIWRLRWAALIGQIAALGVAHLALGVQPHWAKLGVAVLVFAASNAVLGHRLALRQASNPLIVGVLLFDVLLLTALLFWSGGAANPFSAFYVVHVAVAALMLGPAWAFVLVVLTSICFGALFLVPYEGVGPHAMHVPSPLHLRGMWLAYVLSAGFVAYFVSRVAAALRERESQTEALRRWVSGMQRVASLSTVAAGAAHELGSPLASIAVSATELSDALGQHEQWATFAAEAQHIRTEVSRCRDILDRLALGSGQPAGEVLEWISARAIAARLCDELGPSEARSLAVDYGGLERCRVQCPPRALVHALANLVKNGIDASRSGDHAAVVLRFSVQGTRARFEVYDRGPGIPNAVAARLGEPFFTTKPPGKGMGLGLYLVRVFAHQVRGHLRIETPPGGGTLASISLCENSLDRRAST